MTASPTPLTADKQMLLSLRALRQKVEELEGRAREPIAIIGMACRFPGGADNPARYWELLDQRFDAVGDIPSERIDLASAFDTRPQTPGKTYSHWAGLLDYAAHFDAEFFGISPREAVSADPQQRWLLEASWEALEDAGLDPRTLGGRNAGVFVGISNSEYAQLLQRTLSRDQLAAHVLQGSALNAAAGRLSYFYGLTGPSMVIDTACSSSLVALDRACRSLREGESSLAIAAGVNLIASPESLIIASQWGMLSPSGKVRAFDSGADGFVRGEGCGVLVLKRLSDAERAGDRILSVILSSAVNQDGASSGLTVPNGLAQQALLREAHRRAGIAPWQVGYVEAHGTGTALGDPIEAEALGAVFAGREQKLLIGSVKTNIGHLESAAGVAGLIKVVLALQHGVVPGQLHWERPSEHVRWGELPLEVVTRSRAWDPIAGRRIAGVSSFGFSGTNAHVVLEGWPEVESSEAEPGAEVLLLTARTAAALRALVVRYAEFLSERKSGGSDNWSDICYTSAVGRGVFAERLAVVAESKAEAAGKLREWLRGEHADGLFEGRVSVGRRAAGDVLPAGAALAEAAAWFARGDAVDWAARAEGRRLRRVALPTYPFQRERYWIDEVAAAVEKIEDGEPASRGMLGRRLRTAGVRGQFETNLKADSWIGEHVVEGRVVLPATGHIELMLEAGAELLSSGFGLEDVVLLSPLVIEETWRVEKTRRVQTVVEEAEGGRSRVRVYAEAQSGWERGGWERVPGWERVSEGWLLQSSEAAPERVDLEQIRRRLLPDANNTGDAFYDAMAARGLSFGARFRGVERVWVAAADEQTGEALGEIVATAFNAGTWLMRPWWLDACLQVAAMAKPAGEGGDAELYLPMSVERLRVFAWPGGQSGEKSWSHVQMRRLDSQTLSAEVAIMDADGSAIASFSGLRFRKLRVDAPNSIYEEEWIEAPLKPVPSELTGHWLLFSEENQLATELCKQLRDGGATCTTIAGVDEGASATRESLRAVVAGSGPVEGVLDLRSATAIDFAQFEAEDADPERLPAVDASLSLLQALLLEQIHPSHGVWLITRNATGDHAGLSARGRAVQALRRTAVLEFPELAIHYIDLDANLDALPAARPNNAANGDTSQILRAITTIEAAEIMSRGERILTSRLSAAKRRESMAGDENPELVTGDSGLIEDVKTVAVGRTAPHDDEIEIAVQVHGVNFRDVMNALGMLPGSVQKFGGECSGVVTRAGTRTSFVPGERVLAFAPGSFKRFVTVTVSNVMRVPDGMSMAQAAALPIAYLTAFYGLDGLAGLQRGESVLIHSAAGGLGMAAINVARSRGAQIFATAGSEEKRAYLQSLGIEHVLPSRTDQFADDVMRLSGGRGVDVILNSLTGVLAEKTLSVMAHGGRFLEVGKRETMSAETVTRLRPDVRHLVYDLGSEAAADASLVPGLLREMQQLLAEGRIAPLPVTRFADPKEAFRYMAQARHVGKIVVTRSDNPDEHSGLKVDPGSTYLIAGGCGGLGLIFAAGLVERGARHLLLMGRSAPGPAAVEAIDRIRSLGAEVNFVSADVSDRSAVASMLAGIPPWRPLQGILHAAGTLDDHGLLEQGAASLFAVMRPKWHGAWNLHLLTRQHDLDFFVLCSSATVVLGSPGQANYATANAMLDALADYRKRLGLAALSIQWGPWNAAGMTAKMKADPRSFGVGTIDPIAGLAAMEALLSGDAAVAAVLPEMSWKKFVRQRPPDTSALFSLLADEARDRSVEPLHKPERESLPHILERTPANERSPLMMEYLRQQSSRILSLPPQARIDEHEALHDLGMDSLMAVELRNALTASLERQFPPTLVLDYPTLRTLTDFLLEEMFHERQLSSAQMPAFDHAIPSSETDEMNAISDAEAEALLLQELEPHAEMDGELAGDSKRRGHDAG